MSIKKVLFLILAVALGLAACYGYYIAVPMIIYGYKSHAPSDLNGLVGFLGYIVLLPTLLASYLAFLFGYLFYKKEKQDQPNPDSAAPELPSNTDPPSTSSEQ